MQPQWWLVAAVVVAVADVNVRFITDKIDHEKNLHLCTVLCQPARLADAHINARP
jgi:hypothetical protein